MANTAVEKETSASTENSENQTNHTGAEPVRKVFEIRVSDDRMEASLTCSGLEKNMSREKIMAELSARRIVYGIDDLAVDYIVSSYNSAGKPIKDHTIAKGTPCNNGRNGEIKYYFDRTDGPSYKENKDGSIDVRETNVVQCVKEGSEIACIIPHEDPVAGKDVYGKIIPPPKVRKVSLKTARNVKASDDGLHFFAEVNGQPIVEADRMGPRISVTEVFSVSGDLDLSVGNIDFDGTVEIGGDIEDGYKIKATKSIIVHGLVGASSLYAGLDIKIYGGCNGKEQADIKCGRDIEAKYINETSVEARGNVTAKNEIVNSNIIALGRVNVKTGSIRGGKTTAKRGIEAFDFGSDMGIKTVLIPGKDFELEEKCNKIDEKIIETNREVDTIEKRIAPIVKNRELLQKLTKEQHEKLKETLSYLSKLREEKDSLNKKKNILITEAMKDAVPEVVVNHFIYHGVLLKIGDLRREISSQLEGPLRLFEEKERITVEPLSDRGKDEKQ